MAGRNLRTTLVLLLCCLLASVLPGPALAHAVLQETLPTDRAVLDDFPGEFRIQFDEPVAPIRVQLLNGRGETVGLTEIRAVDNELRFAALAAQPEGQYLLSYRVMSLDAHPVSGSIGFAVGDRAAPAATETNRNDPATLILTRITRALHLTALLASFGLMLFPLLVSPSPVLEPVRQRLLAVTTLLGIGTAILGLGLWGVLLAEVSPASLLQDRVWSLANSTTLATSTILATLGLTGMLMSTWFEAIIPRRLLAIAGVAVAATSLGTSGHAAGVETGLLAPVFVIHALMAGVWFGCLWLLYLLVLREPAPAVANLLRRFSRRATAVVVVLLACAVVLTWYQVGNLSGLFGSDYGRWLLLKLGLVLVVLILAAINRWYFTPILASNGAGVRQRLGRSIALETGLMVAVLAVTAMLASTAPPVEQVDRNSRTVSLNDGRGLNLTLAITPARTGVNTAGMVFSRNGKPVDPQEVVLRWSQETAAIEPMEATATKVANGSYRVNDVNLLVDGAWSFRVEALIDDFTQRRFQTLLPIE